jgi:hypothetical protein
MNGVSNEPVHLRNHWALANLGGGWRLRVHDGRSEEVAGGVFPMPPASADDVATWWSRLENGERVEWFERSGATSPAGTHHATCGLPP